MSAILKALNKLEQEKSSINPVISLKELDIDGGGEERSNSLSEKLFLWRGKILLVLAGVILGGLIGKVF